MEPRTCCLITALLLPLAAAAPAPAPAPASPADRANIAMRKQIAAPEVLLRVTVPPGDETTQSLDVADTTQALVCSQIFGVLPFRTFRRQRFDSFTTCTCVSDMTATCEPDTYYPTVAPGTPEAALAMEHNSVGADKFIEVLNAFSVQQTCFFEHLRGQKLSPPRPCAFSWAQGSKPACDCAHPPDVVESGEETEATEVTPAVEAEPQPAPEAPATTPQAPEATDPVTARSTKDAVQSVNRISQDLTAAAEVAAQAVAEVARDAVAAGTEVFEVVEIPDLPGERFAKPTQERRGPAVAESFHLRRVRSARRH